MKREWLVGWMGIVLAASIVALWLDYTLTFAWGIGLLLTLSLSLGAVKDDRLGPFAPFFAAALAAWLASFTLMHTLSHGVDDLFFGLPAATAVEVYLLWLAPLLLTALPYALHFDRFTLTEEDLHRLGSVLGEEGLHELEEVLE